MARTKDFDEKEVLKKAIGLFWDKGYNGTSMQDLVDGLGISRSSLYDTFGDKHQLYVRALQAYRDGHGGKMCTLISEAPSAKEAMQQLLQMVVDNLLGDEQRRGCFMVNAGVELAAHDAEVGTLVCENEQQLEQAFLMVIKKGQSDGELDKAKDPQALARFFGNTVKGLQVSVKSTTDKDFFEDVIKTALSILD